ncbi:MAG: mechanosensitive ion channel family protein [Acidimicrobiales bacterium]
MWQTFVDALPRVGVAVAMVATGWLVGRALRWTLHRVFQRHRTPSFARVMSKVLSWIFVTIVVLLAVAVTFPSVKPVNVLAGLGFFSVAVGFAFQDILENTLAGILLLFRQPFRTGDQIDVMGNAGTVDEINIRETRLTTYDGELVIIPNRDVYKNVINVHTHHDSHRLQFKVGVAQSTDSRHATGVIVDSLRTVAYVAPRPAPVALVTELGDSTINISVMFWTNSQRFASLLALDAAITAVKLRLDAEGIELPAPIVVLQATQSLQAVLHNDPDLTNQHRSA